MLCDPYFLKKNVERLPSYIYIFLKKKIMIEKMVGEIDFLNIDEESFLGGVKP